MNRFKTKITIGDVARLSGVSKATVSSVLNKKPNVSPITRDRVLEVIGKLHYRPNQIARSLSARQTQSVGLVVKQIDNPYFTKIMRGAFDFLSGRGYTVLLGSSELEPEKEKESIETFLRQRVDGLILSPLQGRGTDLSYLSAWIQDRLPLVFLEKVPNIPANVVDIRNAKAAAEAVGYLIGLGHTRIAYLGGPDYSLHNLERIAGFQKAMMEHGLPVRPRFVRKAGVYIDDGHRAAHELFNGTGETPTAVFCFNDLIAIGALNALAERNLRVPEDVSVIGFDDIEFCGSVRVPLTSVSVPAFEMGRAAAGLLIRQIEYREQALNEVVELEAKLVLRASCSAPRQSPISKTGAL